MWYVTGTIASPCSPTWHPIPRLNYPTRKEAEAARIRYIFGVMTTRNVQIVHTTEG